MKHVYQVRSFIQFIKAILITVSIINFSATASSQSLSLSNQQATVETTTLSNNTPAVVTKKRFWRAATEWTMTQLMPMADNYFIRKAAFARISFKSIATNMKPKNLEWDDNKFFNNQVSHPYQGGLYFNAFRSNGFNFWESVPAVIAGTFTWEGICETHFPAPNDLINTALGGVAFGEMSNRISRKLMSRRKNTARKIINAPLCFIINPLNNVNYLLNQGWKKENKAGYDDDVPLSVITEAGMRLITSNRLNAKNEFGKYYKKEMFGSVHLQYGDPYTNFKKPFSNFSVVAEGGNCDTAKINTLQVEGSLYGKKIKQTDHSITSFDVSMSYEYFQNSSFIYSNQSFRAKWSSRFNVSRNIQFQMNGGAGIIPLAAVPNPYMYYGEGRNYDYCMGVIVQIGAGINIANRLFYDVNASATGLQTIDGYKSSHLSYNTTSALRLVVYKNISISADSGEYYFNGYYKNYANVSDHHQFFHFSAGYQTTF